MDPLPLQNALLATAAGFVAKAAYDHMVATPALSSSTSSSRGGRGRSSKMAPTNRSDLAIAPLKSSNVPRRVPRNLASKITWDIVKVRGVTSTTIGAITEQNFSFSLSSHPQASNWASLFDQWTIVQVSISWYSQEPPSSTGSIVELHTALDFDNTASLGGLTQIDDYSSAQVDNLVYNKVVTRSIKPCVKLSANATGNVVPSREWCDASTPGANFYGIRSIYAAASSAFSNVTTETTIWFAFRNSI